jgi:hypothetical protein
MFTGLPNTIDRKAIVVPATGSEFVLGYRLGHDVRTVVFKHEIDEQLVVCRRTDEEDIVALGECLIQIGDAELGQAGIDNGRLRHHAQTQNPQFAEFVEPIERRHEFVRKGRAPRDIEPPWWLRELLCDLHKPPADVRRAARLAKL